MPAGSFTYMSLPDESFRKPQGMIAVQFYDPSTYAPLGGMTSYGSCKADLDLKPEYIDLRDNQTQRRSRIARRCSQLDATLKLSMMQFLPATLAQIYMAPQAQFWTQSASVATVTKHATNVGAFGIIELTDPVTNMPLLDVSAVVVTATTGAVALTLNVDYVLDALVGVVQVRNPPADGLVTVACTVPAITPAGQQSLFSIMKNPEQTARVIQRQNNLLGANLYHVWPKVQFGAPGSIPLIGNSNDTVTIDMEGTVLSDSRYPGNEDGFSILITGAAAA